MTRPESPFYADGNYLPLSRCDEEIAERPVRKAEGSPTDLQYRLPLVLRSRRVDFALGGESVKVVFGYCVAIGKGGREGRVW